MNGLSAVNFVAVRTVTGGPAASALNPEIERALEQCEVDREWLEGEMIREAKTEERRRAESVKLILRV